MKKEELLIVFKSISLEKLCELKSNVVLEMFKCEEIVKEILLGASSSYFITPFDKLISKLDIEMLKVLFSHKNRLLIDASSTKPGVVKSILTSKNKSLVSLLLSTDLIDYIMESLCDYSYIVEEIPEESKSLLADYVVLHKDKYISYIEIFNSKKQLEIIERIGIYTFYNLILDTNIFETLDRSVITILISKEPFNNYFTSLKDEEILRYIEEFLVLPKNLSNNKRIVDIISSIKDPNEYRCVINSFAERTHDSFNHKNKKRYDKYKAYLERIKYINRDYEVIFKPEEEIYPSSLVEFDVSYIESARKSYYDSIYYNLEHNLLKEYFNFLINPSINELHIFNNCLPLKKQIEAILKGNSYESLEAALYNGTTKMLLEILIDKYFEDHAYNFLINMRSIINFFDNYDIDLIKDKDLTGLLFRLDIYRCIDNFYELSRDEQIKLYERLSHIEDLTRSFYDDFSLAKECAYDDYNKKTFNFEKNKDKINVELSEETGVTIYEYTGEEFYMFTHITNYKRDSVSNFYPWEDKLASFYSDPFITKSRSSGISLSLTGSKQIALIRDAEKFVTFGFCKLNPKRIMHVYHADSWSTCYENGVGTNKINEILSTEQLIDMTDTYNEIVYQEVSEIALDENMIGVYEAFNPDYIICFGEVMDYDIALAKKMNLPIVNINTKYYDYKKEVYEYLNRDNEYFSRLYDFKEIKKYIKK